MALLFENLVNGQGIVWKTLIGSELNADLKSQGWVATTSLAATTPPGTSIYDRMTDYPGLTFFKNYASMNTIDADYSGGSSTATFTASRGASNPATYIDSSGVIQTTTTSNTPRFTSGFYDSTGFVSRPGLIVEGASTNLFASSSTLTVLSEFGATATDIASVNPAGGATSSKMHFVSGFGALYRADTLSTNTYTISMWVKSQGANTDIKFYPTQAVIGTATSSGWTRISLAVSITAGFQNWGIQIQNTGVDVLIWGMQFELSPFATSLIPTSSGALTRNAEGLEYPILSNRTADTESIFCKFSPFFSSANNGSSNRYLTGTETKDRRLLIFSDDVYAFPNWTDSVGSVANVSNTVFSANANMVWASAQQRGVSPYVVAYRDGVVGTSETADDFTAPAWGTNFGVGFDGGSGGYLYGIIQSLAIFSDAKSAANVLAISNLMAGA